MNFNNVVSAPQAADLSGKENYAVKMTSTGINLSATANRTIGTLRRAHPKQWTGSAVGLAVDVYLNSGQISYATLGNTSAAIATGAGLILDTDSANIGKLVPSETNSVAIAWQAATGADGTQIQVLWL